MSRFNLRNIIPALLLLTAAAATILSSCDSNRNADTSSGDNIFSEAVFIKGSPAGDNAMRISVVNPWDSTAMLADYLLVNGGDSITSTDASGPAVTLRLPLKRMVVYSAVHAALLAELGYADAIVGVADAQYIKTPELRQRLADGRIADVGSSVEPSIEKIIALNPDGVLISPFQNSGHGAVDKAGIPVIECADYMETTPLGRAEWATFYSMLAEGISPRNNATFAGVKERYDSLRTRAAAFKEKPKVITEMQNRGTWLMPGGNSYAARLIADAGATYPFAENRSPGSTPMPYEKVLLAAEDADFWLLKSLDDITLKDVAANHRFNKNFWAYKSGGVYFANTAEANLFEETPFHPDRLLSDYVAMFHRTGAPLRYYKPVPAE